LLQLFAEPQERFNLIAVAFHFSFFLNTFICLCLVSIDWKFTLYAYL